MTMETFERSAFGTSAGLWAIAVDFMRQSATGESFLPRNALRTAVRVAAGSARIAAGSGGGPAWREFANKLRVWELFSFADRFGDSRMRELDSSAAVWVAEGVGYAFGRESSSETSIPVHTGLGLALAERALRAATASGRLAGALAAYRQDCIAHAAPGYADSVYEALGLTAVTLYPYLLAEIDRELAYGTGPLGELFWHGVGRGLYFTPLAFVPLSSVRNRTVDFARRMPVTPAARKNTLAGIAWALTLVNLDDPDVIESWLRNQAFLGEDRDAIANGVASALIVWDSAAPDNGPLERLARYRPVADGTNFAELWYDVITAACRQARRLADEGRTGALAPDVFRFRAPPDAPG